MENEKDLQPIIIDLDPASRGELDESWLAMFGGAIESIMGAMFGGKKKPNIRLKGNKAQIKSFAKSVGQEKKYIKSVAKYGLDDPRVMKDKYKLQKAVSGFERDTGLKWPFKD